MAKIHIFAITLTLLIVIVFYNLVNVYMKYNSLAGSSREKVDYSENGELGSLVFDIDVAHTQNISHRGIWLFVLDGDKQNLLFLKRSIHHVTCADSWSLLGEHSSPNEDYYITLLRGLKEELTLSKTELSEIGLISDLELFHFYHPKAQRRDLVWMKTYYVILKPNIKIKRSYEDSQHKWIPLNSSMEWYQHCDDVNNKKCRYCTDATDIYVKSTSHINKNIYKIVNYTSFYELTSYKVNILKSLLNNKNRNKIYTQGEKDN